MIYLDNAATSYPKPPSVLPLFEDYLIYKSGNPGRSGHKLSLSAADAVFKTRERVATFIGCRATENIIFTQNATHALNTIIRARIQPGSHVLISDLEHNSVFRPIWRLSRDGIITYSVFSHKGDILTNIQNALHSNTKMLICTHISNVTGFEMPVKEIAAFCRKADIYMIIDASQSIGHLKIDVNELDCDALCAPGHKGLLGLQGSGFIYVREKNGLKDVFQGGSGTHSLSPDMPDYLPDRFEAGTLPVPAIISLQAGLDYLEERSVEAVHAHEIKLSRLMHSHIREIPEATLYSAPNSGIVSFRLPYINSEQFADLLDEHGICVRGGYHCAPLAHNALNTLGSGLVRLSIGAFNSMGEIEVAAHHIRLIAKKQGN